MRKTAALTALIVAATVGILATRSETRAAPEAVVLDDAAIVAIFDLANKADIETGRLATERADSREVRDFGRMLVDVHTAVRQQGGDLAKKLGVTPVLPKGDQSAQQHAAVMARLGKLRGAEFDRAFLQHEQAFHAAVISAVTNTLLPAIQNQELKKFVASLAPAFEAHRLQAENLGKKLSPAD
jgi:putative membrane protein